MNAFTQKPDLSQWVKAQRPVLQGRHNGIHTSGKRGGQIVPGMGNCDPKKTQVQKGKP